MFCWDNKWVRSRTIPKRYPLGNELTVCELELAASSLNSGFTQLNSLLVIFQFVFCERLPELWKDPPFSSWVNQLFQWPFSIAMLNYQRVFQLSIIHIIHPLLLVIGP